MYAMNNHLLFYFFKSSFLHIFYELHETNSIHINEENVNKFAFNNNSVPFAEKPQTTNNVQRHVMLMYSVRKL